MLEWMTANNALWMRDLMASTAFIATVIIMRTVLVRLINRPVGLSLETKRRWMVSIRNAALFISVVGLVLIWAHEIRTLAISLVAVGAAIVIATRDFILCFSGGVWRIVSQAYKVGDRIKIGETRGDVVDINFLATTVMELESGTHAHQYTGRAVVFPNSLLLTLPVAAESYTGAYRVRTIRVPLSLRVDWEKARQRLLDVASEECAEYLEAARTHMSRMQKEEGLETPAVEPRVAIELPEPDRVDLLLRVAVPAAHEGRITQKILSRFLAGLESTRSNPVAVE